MHIFVSTAYDHYKMMRMGKKRDARKIPAH